MKLALLATVLTLAVTTTAVADQFTPVGGGTAKGGGRFLSFVDRDSVESGKNGQIRFIIVNQFEKPQQLPNNKKAFKTALQEIIANCSSKTLMNPTIALLADKKTLVERMQTGETKLAVPPANAKVMLEPALELACQIAEHPDKNATKGKH